MREVIDLLLPHLRAFEGLRLVSVPVAHGRHEVGYGHTCRSPCEVTPEEAERLLYEDACIALRAVAHAVRYPLSIAQQAALASFAFNVGAGALLRSTLVKKLNAGDVRGAADEFGRWIYAGGNVLPGLVERRRRERELFLSGVDSVGAGVGDDEPAIFEDERPGAVSDVAPELPKNIGTGGDAQEAEKAGAGGWILQRIREPSTWRGLGGLLAAAGVLSLGSVDALIAVGMAVWSAVEVIRKERGAAS